MEEHLRKPSTSQTLLVEKLLRVEYERFVLVGRLDRVDERPDGSLEIVDYKSGRGAIAPQDVAADLAMNCYQLLLSKAYPARDIVTTIVALRTGASASASLNPTQLAEFETDLEKLGDQIVTDELFDRVPRLKPLCRTCDFLPLCRRHPDFDDDAKNW